MRINAKLLLYGESGDGCRCGCKHCCIPETVVLYTATINGARYVTNRYSLVRTDVLDESLVPPPAWCTLHPDPLAPDQADKIRAWMEAPLAGSAKRRFNSAYLRAVEDAGGRVAAITGQNNAHAILLDGEVVGCLMPLTNVVDETGTAVPKAVSA